MKEITIRIPDYKYKFFLELIQNLGFEKTEDIIIPEEHKSIVRERIKSSKPDELIPWQEARKKLRFKDEGNAIQYFYRANSITGYSTYD